MTDRIQTVTATDLRIITAEILDQVKFGHVVAVTRQGKTIAYLVPADKVEKAVAKFDQVINHDGWTQP